MHLSPRRRFYTSDFFRADGSWRFWLFWDRLGYATHLSAFGQETVRTEASVRPTGVVFVFISSRCHVVFFLLSSVVSGQPSNLLGKMLHVFDQNWFKLGLRWRSDFNCMYTCWGSVVWLVLCWHSVSNFQFKFSTHPQGTSCPPPNLPPPLSLSVFFLPLFLLWLTSFTPSHLTISSHLALKSLFQFQNALKPLPARRSLALPRDKTLGLFTFPLHCTLLEGKVPRDGCIRTIPGFNSVGKSVHAGSRWALRNKMLIGGSVSVDSTWNLWKNFAWGNVFWF